MQNYCRAQVEKLIQEVTGNSKVRLFLFDNSCQYYFLAIAHHLHFTSSKIESAVHKIVPAFIDTLGPSK